MSNDLKINGLIPGNGKCVITDCGVTIAGGYLMCQPHWELVPIRVAARLSEVMEDWKWGLTNLGELRDLQRECVAIVEASDG